MILYLMIIWILSFSIVLIKTCNEPEESYPIFVWFVVFVFSPAIILKMFLNYEIKWGSKNRKMEVNK